MTEKNSNDMKINEKEARIKRRSLLKAGMVAAPLAMTLHGGIPLAHAESTDCVEELEKHIEIPHDDDGDGVSDRTEPFDPETGLTGGTNSDGTSETHWDYLINKDKVGASCLQSIEDSGGHHEFHLDSEHPSDLERPS